MSEEKSLTREEKVALMHRWYDEVWGQGNEKSIDEIFSQEGIAYGLGEAGLDVRGPEEFKPFVRKIRESFSNIKFDIEDVLVEGEQVVTRWVVTMTHTGPGFGEPTGKTVRVGGMSWTGLKNGQILGGWNNWDMLGLIQQINADPVASPILKDVAAKR
jgi:predicted ester cyclase